MLGYHHPPKEQTPPWEQTPPGTDPPLGADNIPPPRTDTSSPQSRHPPGSRLQHTVYEQPVCILLECILVTPVCHSVHGGVCLSACWDTTTPPSPGADTPLGADPPGADTPQSTPPRADTPYPRADTPQSRHPSHLPGADTHPPPGSRLRHTVNERPVRILLECILVLYNLDCLFIDHFRFRLV